VKIGKLKTSQLYHPAVHKQGALLADVLHARRVLAALQTEKN